MQTINEYSITFESVCPADGERIKYAATIVTDVMIRAEDIVMFVNGLSESFHEQIADAMWSRFGGLQVISAVHQGVNITTRRIGREMVMQGEDDVSGMSDSSVVMH